MAAIRLYIIDIDSIFSSNLIDIDSSLSSSKLLKAFNN